MSKASKSWAGAFLAAAVAAGLTATAIPAQAGTRAAPAAHPPKAAPVVVASGLHNPRAVRVQADGSVLVTEAGNGSGGPCTTPGTRCLGLTGSLYRVKGSRQGRVVTGLPSEMGVRADGSTAVNGAIQAEATAKGTYRVVYGLNGTPAIRAALGPDAAPLGTLSIAGGRALGDLADHEGRLDPDSVLGNNEVFSNPHNFARDGRDFLVTDAAANTLIRVHPDGTTTTEFVFPNSILPAASPAGQPLAPAGQTEAVPTGIVRGRDGAFYLATMGGMHEGLSRVWRYVPGSRPTVFATGLTDVTDLALAPDGDLIALSYGTRTSLPPADPGPGALTRINKRTGALTPIDTGNRLNMPAGVTVSRNGDIYVTNNALGTSGQLLKFPAR
ncbi:ScyD/ScyE family protein [Streptomyces asoensis]|uniref:ScyD/ScyE family protein n=1 Tax=Streptomyces asoensis TaxID=249586 RepID=A0A6M4WEX4_9ACTN|nr:ScyD/ScyE family protein [Streptomyces asoensis]QJS98983.1 ScyD/ScyE family protein [Streptomyces asoensis]QJT06486.1 ScyD/ScyE family protein [Streptomyces asoensis]